MQNCYHIGMLAQDVSTTPWFDVPEPCDAE